ncbi:DUF6578 domain-containing protein [Streptomyces sp. NPDC059788]|uniref:DUF6578 domain-containing protein n=1 Tax=Streptomyces sp. NPDC059788 TaxID=3346948 RepID=UPI0036484847
MADSGAERTVRVLHRDWEVECCGTPFAVGDEVAWPLVFESVAEADAAVWADCLDERGLLRVATLHGAAPEKGSGAPWPAGHVRSIDVVVVGYGGDGRPVPGERWLRPVERCPKRFAARVVDRVTGGGEGGVAGARRHGECGVVVGVDVARGESGP